MSRKDYKAIADILKKHKANPALIKDIADYFKEDNFNFKYDKFYHAAGLE